MTIFTFFMLALLIGCGFYFMLSTRYAEVIIGIALTSNGINLLLVESGQNIFENADPLPQALILTAIVIGFSLLSFMTAYALDCLKKRGSDEILLVNEEYDD